jgi:hypothetical protein
LWWQGRLSVTLTLGRPGAVVCLALGATVFVSLMLLANLLEWRRLRTTLKTSF